MTSCGVGGRGVDVGVGLGVAVRVGVASVGASTTAGVAGVTVADADGACVAADATDAGATDVGATGAVAAEEGALAETIELISKQRVHFKEMEIVVINDGSKDRTGEVAESLAAAFRLPTHVVHLPVNSGIGVNGAPLQR